MWMQLAAFFSVASLKTNLDLLCYVGSNSSLGLSHPDLNLLTLIGVSFELNDTLAWRRLLFGVRRFSLVDA